MSSIDMETEKPVLVATHDGAFHADDVFAYAIVAQLFPLHRLQRSRSPSVLANADILIDVGGVHDAAHGRFDHHQGGFSACREAPSRAAGVLYASSGLVWDALGLRYLEKVALSAEISVSARSLDQAFEQVDFELMQHIDQVDNGNYRWPTGSSGVSSLIGALNTSWVEERSLDAAALADLQLARFLEASAMSDRLLRGLAARLLAKPLAAEIVRNSDRLLGGKLLVLPQGGMPWRETVLTELQGVMLVMYHDKAQSRFVLQTVPATGTPGQNRLDLPVEWGALSGEELAAATGCQDAIFCHRNLFICAARTFEGALRLAELVLERHVGLSWSITR